MKRKNMFSKLIYPAAAFAGTILLAACSADELGTVGGSTVIPPTSEGVSSGTVEFTNNTSVTVGNLSSLTRSSWMTRGKTFDFDGNAACTLEMIDKPTIMDEGSVVDNTGEKTLWTGDITGRNLTVKAGATCELTGDSGRKITSDVYVFGTFNLETYCSNGSGEDGNIIVYEGGTLNINNLKNQDLSGISILNYGGTININVSELTIGSTAELMTTGDFNHKDLDLKVNGKLYVGGNMTFKNLSSTVSGAQIHVLGSLTGNLKFGAAQQNPYEDGDVILSNAVSMCVEGAMTVRYLNASNGANVHADCKLVTFNGGNCLLSITNGATLCASYIDCTEFALSGGDYGNTAYLYLPEQGVMNVHNNFKIGNHSKILPYGEGSKALVAAKTITMDYGVTWEDVFDPALYVNYTTIWADADPLDTSKHNVATINSGTYECSPGFTTKDDPTDPDPDPEPTPDPSGDGDIVMELPSGIFDDYELNLRADDFAIRVDGEYIEDIKVSGNTASLNELIEIIDDRLAITVSGLNYDNILDDTDYTYEIWMWVSNKKLLNDGTGSYGPLFSTEDYLRWIGLSADTELPVDYTSPDYEAGVDYTQKVPSVTSPAGYEVRYNVYRGLSGHIDKTTGLGDTPYIKVSIHVRKNVNAPENTAVGVYPTAE